MVRLIMNNNFLKILIVFLIIIFSGVLTYTIMEHFTNSTEEVNSKLAETNNVERIQSVNEHLKDIQHTCKGGILNSSDSNGGSMPCIINSLFLFIVVLVLLYILLRNNSENCNRINKHIEDNSSTVNYYYNDETRSNSKLLADFNNSCIDIIDEIIQGSKEDFEPLKTYKKLLNAYAVIMSNDETYKSKENAAYYINKYNKHLPRELMELLLSDGIITKSLYSIIETDNLYQS